MKKNDFFYDLPKEFIAQKPATKRDNAKLLALFMSDKKIEHGYFRNIEEYFNCGDILVLNNTKVIPARIKGFARFAKCDIDILLVSQQNENLWNVLVYPGNKAKIGEIIDFGENLEAEIKDFTPEGRLVEFKYKGDFNLILEDLGEPPLPHYIKRQKGTTRADRLRYQTVYAQHNGAIAAPTAGLHFTKKILNNLQKKGVEILKITLHVGLGSFKPIKTEDVLEHKMQSEYFEIDSETFSKILQAHEKKRRVIAVGTSSVRAIESAVVLKDFKGSAKTDIFIYPGFKFKIVDAMITNFHMPCSTPMILVCAFAGKDLIFESYKQAIENKYRFLSFGDAMIIFT